MNLQTKALSMLPKGTLLGIVKKQFEKKVDFKVEQSIIQIDYLANLFSLTLKNSTENKVVKKSDKVTEFTDLSDILMNKVKEKIEAKDIDVIIIDIDFVSKETVTHVFYTTNIGEKKRSKFNDLF